MGNLEIFGDFVISAIREPAIFIGLIATIGLILQRKSFSDVVKGGIKSVAGILVLFAGVDVVVGAIEPLASAFTVLFQIEGGLEVADFSLFVDNYGSQIGMVMLFGFMGNLIIARFTPLKTIFLTGNFLFWFAMLFIAVGVEAGLNDFSLIAFALFFQLLYTVLFPWLNRPLVKELTGDDSFTIGHTASIFCLIGAFIGRHVGNPDNSTENIKLPRFVEFFSDTTVVSGLMLFVVNLSAALLLDGASRTEIMGDGYTLACFMNGVKFSAGMVIILAGARMMLSEIVPAFSGISERLIKGAVPALDIPLVFPYGPNALIIGFICATVASIAAIFILGFSGLLTVAVVPLTIACYFDVAPAAIFANKRGGIKAAIAASAVGGVILIVLAAVTIPLISATAGSFLRAYGGNDFSLLTLISSLSSRIFQ